MAKMKEFLSKWWTKLVWSWASKLIDGWNNHWRWWDNLAAVGGFVAAVAYLAWQYDLEAVETFLAGIRSGMYQTIASVAGGLLGFVITGVSILLAFGDTPRLQAIRRTRQYKDVFTVFSSAWRWLGVVTLLALLGNLVDKDQTPRLWFSGLVAFTLFMSAVRMGRSLWVLEKMIGLAVADQKEKRAVKVAVPGITEAEVSAQSVPESS